LTAPARLLSRPPKLYFHWGGFCSLTFLFGFFSSPRWLLSDNFVPSCFLLPLGNIEYCRARAREREGGRECESPVLGFGGCLPALCISLPFDYHITTIPPLSRILAKFDPANQFLAAAAAVIPEGAVCQEHSQPLSPKCCSLMLSR
jgi:hypothetical protein